MIMNNRTKKDSDLQNTQCSIKIGDVTINSENSAKLLGITIDSNQKWSSQINGVGGTVKSLNSRLYLLKRLSKSISKERLRRVADSLYTSKIRYGIQLFGMVRLKEDDVMDPLMKRLQSTQNKFARFINGSTLKNKISTKSIFKSHNLLSVNQINAQVKLQEVWKSLHNIKYPVNWVNKNDSKVRKDLRSCNVTVLKDTGTSKIQSASFYNDAARVWNQAPIQIKNCLSLSAVKRETKKYVKTLPI